MSKEREDLIKHFSYYFSDSEDFVEEHLDNYKEMIYILSQVYKNIKGNMKEEYKVFLGTNKIMFENKKTKECYFINIEF